jgi:hypothetical protein
MKANYKKAQAALIALGVPTYQRADMANFGISAEDSNSYLFLDYYEGYRMDGWDFGVNPIIDKTLAKYGLRCEWQNPGELSVYAD